MVFLSGARKLPLSGKLKAAPGDVYWSSVSLLLEGKGSDTSTSIIDTSKNNLSITKAGNAQISTGASMFNGSSIKLDGTGDYLVTASSSVLGLGTGDFTIEFWMRRASDTKIVQAIVDMRPNGSATATKPNITYQTDQGYLGYSVGNSRKIQAGALTADVWYHVAVARASSTTKMFLDGAKVGVDYTTSNDFGTSNDCVIGTVGDARGTYNGYYNGYIQDIRITKGYARYTAAFTRPSRPYLNH